MSAKAWCAVVAAALAVSCIGDPAVSDTGYVGSWSRGNERQRSQVYIDREGDRYRFRIEVRSDDGVRVLECDEQARCEERIRGAKTLEYRFWTRIEEDTGRLIVEYDVTSLRDGSTYRYVDVLTVEDDGLTLRAETIERDGVKLDTKGARPTRVFSKISNRILVPARSGSPP